jgi:hypothetical protein
VTVASRRRKRLLRGGEQSQASGEPPVDDAAFFEKTSSALTLDAGQCAQSVLLFPRNCGFSRNPRPISMGDDPDTKDPSSRGECTARHISDKSNVR